MKARFSPFVWVTWLTGILSADDSCRWAPWVKTQHTYDKRPDPNGFDLAGWKAEHGDLVSQRAAQLRAEGWAVTVEDQNKFTVKGRAVTLAGCPDLVATYGLDVLIVDAKTGSRKGKDIWQVLIYMLALPMVREFGSETRIFGEVAYKDGQIRIAPGDFTEASRARILALLQEVGAGPEPGRVPSARECAFCDIAACPDRVTAPVAEAVTHAF